MRRWAAPVTALVILLAGALWYQQYLARVRAGFPAPDFALPDLGGNLRRLSDFRGKVVLLNVWATWCAPCREEMPSMEQLHRALRNEEFAILAVSQDQDGARAVAPFVEEFGITFPVLIDPRGEVARKFGVTGYPETFIIDKDGKVLIHHIGYQNWADPSVQKMLRDLVHARRDGGPPRG